MKENKCLIVLKVWGKNTTKNAKNLEKEVKKSKTNTSKTSELSKGAQVRILGFLQKNEVLEVTIERHIIYRCALCRGDLRASFELYRTPPLKKIDTHMLFFLQDSNFVKNSKKKKRRFFLDFHFDLTLFSVGNRQNTKKNWPRPPSIQNLGQKMFGELPKLTEKGLRIGVLKHAHHNFDVDKPGKDSYRLRKAGASQMLISSRYRHALMTETPENEANFEYLISRFDDAQLDLILVEGCKNIAFPKIELNREEVGKPWLHPSDINIIAIAADRTVG